MEYRRGIESFSPSCCVSEPAASRSCATPLSLAEGREVTTLEGLGTPEKPHPVQQAFIDEEVPQCGYCLNGWIMTSVALLEKNPRPSDAQAARSRSQKPVKTAGGVDANASKQHLMDVAKRLEIRGRSSMNKQQLVDAIQKANNRSTRKAREK